MAAPSTTDPEVDAFAQCLRNVLMQVPARNRSGFFRHVEDMLEVWGRMLERDDVWQCRASSHEERTTTPEDTLREAGSAAGARRSTSGGWRASWLGARDDGEGGGTSLSRSWTSTMADLP